jgi:hypothetical protein
MSQENDTKKLEFIFNYAKPVLREYLFKKFDIDLCSVCQVPAKNPEILIKTKQEKYALRLEVVDKDYVLDFDIITKDENEEEKKKLTDELIKHCTFLVNAVNVSFNYFKRTLKRSKESEEYFLLFISMGIDENTNLYIDEDDLFRIGITINKVNN